MFELTGFKTAEPAIGEKIVVLAQSAHQGASVNPSLGREGLGGFDTKTSLSLLLLMTWSGPPSNLACAMPAVRATGTIGATG